MQRQTKEEGETNFTAESTFGHSTTLMFVFPAPLPSFFTVCSQQTGRLKKTCFNLEIEAPCSSSSIQPIEYLSILYLRLSRVSCQTSDAAMLPEKEIFVKFGAIDAHFHGPSVLLEISTHASYGVCVSLRLQLPQAIHHIFLTLSGYGSFPSVVLLVAPCALACSRRGPLSITGLTYFRKQRIN